MDNIKSLSSKFIVNKILEGVPVREVIFDDEVPAESVTAGEDFIDSAKNFSSYLLRTYPFISKVEPDIRFETKYISNFFIEVETNGSYYMPEKSISKFDLEDLVQGEKVYYGAGDDVGDVEYSIESVGRDLSDLFYKDALKFDLVPVKTKKSYSIMTYSKESYYYRISNSGDNLHLRLEFYTDIGLAGNK